ncbi:MAG: hypothetical protein N2B02_09835, partial [Amylibacter sp.]
PVNIIRKYKTPSIKNVRRNSYKLGFIENLLFIYYRSFLIVERADQGSEVGIILSKLQVKVLG